MAGTCLAEHLSRYAELNEKERKALDRLTMGTRTFRRGTVIQPERGTQCEIMVVRSGWLFCAALLEDGRRQITRLHFHGDLIGLDGLAFKESFGSVVALTDAELCVVDRLQLGHLFSEHPRLGALLFAIQQVDRLTLIERIVTLGRASARGRLAALLLWIANRLRFAGLSIDEGFVVPLTQEEMGDLTGLTAVHVNRTMRVLGEQDLISRSGGTLRILDAARLSRIANYSDQPVAIDASWLPDGSLAQER
jgi:CRP/FNR family transcriptional regulator, anaerobic regulatory protein